MTKGVIRSVFVGEFVFMKIEQNFSLLDYNTFRVKAKTRWFMEYSDEDELLRILRDEYFRECLSLHIGSGSNLLFVNNFNGIILHSRIKGIELADETADEVLLRIGAAELWDDVVSFAVSKGWGGIENLSLIPGETGAAAVQNIGAYGMEIKDVIDTIEAYNQLTNEKRIFKNHECKYAYRHSFFKEIDHDPYIVTYVTLRLQKHPAFKTDYGNLCEALKDSELSLSSVRDAVIEIRRKKLPDPAELGNAGSFFMNPVESAEKFGELKALYPEIPSYPAGEGRVKIPAAWLIERCGFKGMRVGNVGVYDKQALIIVNHGNATGDEIATFADTIINTVNEKFGITLTPEVRYVE
jgi:UDP-N-acetylmuramate dehydrogenase